MFLKNREKLNYVIAQPRPGTTNFIQIMYVAELTMMLGQMAVSTLV